MSSLLLPMHLMAMLTLGLLIGQQGWGSAAVAAFVAAVLAGLGAIALATVPIFAGEALLAATAITGLILALARPWPAYIGAALAAATGLSLALDSPPEALSLREANLALVSIAAGASIGVWTVAWLSARLRRHWQRLGARIVGSWMAASAILVLALRLLR